MDPKYMLEQKGVSFPEGAYVLYHPAKGLPEHETPRGQFVVHNTPEQLKRVAAIIADYNKKTSPSKPKAPQLYKQVWRVPKDFLGGIRNIDDTITLWEADPQISIAMMTNTRFMDIAGASATFKNGKLTIVNTRERLEEMQEYLNYSCTRIGDMTPISAKDANRLKPKKRKKKVRTHDGRVLDIDELYETYDPQGGNSEK